MAISIVSPPALLRQALRSVFVHRLRAALSVLGVVCGVVSFVLLVCVSEGARRDTLDRIGRLGMANVLVRPASLADAQLREARRLGSPGLVRSDGDRLVRAVPSIRSVGMLRELRASADAAGAARPLIVAADPAFLRLSGVSVLAGRMFGEEDVRTRRAICIIGEAAARRFGGDGRVGGVVRIDDAMYRVVGIIGRGPRHSRGGPALLRDFDNAILLPLGTESAFSAKPDEVSDMLVEFDSAERVMPALPALRRALAVAHRGVEDVHLIAPQELLRQADNAQKNFAVLAASIAIVALLTGGIGIMNTMLASVTERTREIGVRRAVGATQRDILMQFLAEAVTLTAAGATAGLAAGLAAALAVSALAGWPVAITPWAVLPPVAAALLAGVFFGGYPALLAARMDPVEALRHS